MIQFFFTIIFLLAAYGTWRRVGEKAVSRGTAALWSILWLGGLTIVWYPGLTSYFATLVGIGRGADLVVYVALITVFWLLFRVLVHLTYIERQITRLVETEALRGTAGVVRRNQLQC